MKADLYYTSQLLLSNRNVESFANEIIFHIH